MNAEKTVYADVDHFHFLLTSSTNASCQNPTFRLWNDIFFGENIIELSEDKGCSWTFVA